MLIIALAKDIKANLNLINRMAKRKKNRSQILTQFKVSVHYHSIAIKLSEILYLQQTVYTI